MSDLTERIDIRLSKQDKEKVTKVLNDINKTKNKKVGYRFLLMEFVNNYLATSSKGLEIEKEQLLRERENKQQAKNKIVEDIAEIDIKIKKLDHEINNKSLYDLSNYKYNDAIIKAVNRIKEYATNPDNKIKVFEDIPNDLYLQMQDTFNISEKDLLKNIVSVEFEKWQNEILINNTEPEPTKEDIIKDVGEKMLKRFNSPKQKVKKLSEYLETDQANHILQKYCINQDNIIKENDIKNYLLSLPQKKQEK